MNTNDLSFNPVSECPKCGASCDDTQVTVEQTFDLAAKRWTESKKIVSGNISTTFVKLNVGQECLCSRKDGVEHIHRKCLVCGFYWSEGTLEQLGE